MRRRRMPFPAPIRTPGPPQGRLSPRRTTPLFGLGLRDHLAGFSTATIVGRGPTTLSSMAQLAMRCLCPSQRPTLPPIRPCSELQSTQRLSWSPLWMRAQNSLTCSCSLTHRHASASRLNVFTTRDLSPSSVTWTSQVGLSFRGRTLYVTLIFCLPSDSVYARWPQRRDATQDKGLPRG